MNLSRISEESLRRAHRLWVEYGILWMGAVLVGLVAVMYAQAIEYGFDAFLSLRHAWPWAPLLVTPAVSALCVWLTRRYFAGSEGSGIPQVIATLGGDTTRRGLSLLSVRILLGKLGLSILEIMGGLTIGREGPTVQIGAAIMFNLRRSYLPGMPGGMFAPSLSSGAGFGNLLHLLFGNTSLGMLNALAMVGYLAAVTQSPITAFVIVMEMVNGHTLVISLMATALVASSVSKFFAPPLYETLAERYASRRAESATPDEERHPRD